MPSFAFPFSGGLGGGSSSGLTALGDADNNITKLLRCLLGPTVDLEAALQQLLTERAVDTAIGVQLDQIGAIVGEARQGHLDDAYRRYVRARIAVERSRGTMADVYRVARATLGTVTPPEILAIENQGAAALVLLMTGGPLVTDTITVLASMLRQTVAAGVHIIEEIAMDVDSETLFTPWFTTLNGALSIGATTINVASTVAFPSSGSIIMEAVISKAAETVTYTGKTSTSFTGCSALTIARSDLTGVAFAGPGKGLGDSTNATVGGKLALAQD